MRNGIHITGVGEIVSSDLIGPPRPGERCGCALYPSSMRAALLFDRISTGMDCIPELGGDAHKAISMGLAGMFIPSELMFRACGDVKGLGEEIENQWQKAVCNARTEGVFDKAVDDALYEKYIMKYMVERYRCLGHTVVPVYGRQQQFCADFPDGNAVVYQAAIENLPEVDEAKASWPQIIEFRKDAEAVRKYRNLRLWLEESLKATSVNQAQEIIAKKVDDYEWALHKYGMEVTIGALSSVMKWQGIATIAGGAGVAGLLGGPVYSAIAAGSLVVGKVAVWLAELRLKKHDVERGPGSEIAVICDAKRKFGKQGGKQ